MLVQHLFCDKPGPLLDCAGTLKYIESCRPHKSPWLAVLLLESTKSPPLAPFTLRDDGLATIAAIFRLTGFLVFEQ
jgi:hypothetical protein